MPQWIESRAKHIQAKNPSMPESEAWAIATQQGHALGKTPKGYGTAEGRRTAKAKFDTPKDDEHRADPRRAKTAAIADILTGERATDALLKFAFELSRFSGPLNPMPPLAHASGQPDPGQAMAPTSKAVQALIKKEGNVASPATQLSKTTHIGLPTKSLGTGPSLRDQVKPVGPGTGIGIPGMDKGGL